MANKLLIDDYPIQVLPKLAKEIGLNEAIFVQQLHYWINGKSGKMIDGKKWIYNTFTDWQEQFPFWSVSTIKRVINSCVKQEIVIKGNFNKAGFDKTVWYTLNYKTIERVNQRVVQNEPTSGSKWTNGEVQNEPTNTIDYTETTSETTNILSSAEAQDRVPYREIVDYLNEKTGRAFKSTTSKTRTSIQARYNEGFELDDFKKVIDNKVSDWLGNNDMAKFLRPETLFGNKFEGYLNETKGSSGGGFDSDWDFFS